MMRARVHRGRRTTKTISILPRLEPQEYSVVLSSLLGRHPTLEDEAEMIARAVVASVETGTVAEEVEQAVMSVDMEEMGAHSGRKSWGYVEPTDAAWELLERTLEPFLVQVKRLAAGLPSGRRRRLCARSAAGVPGWDPPGLAAVRRLSRSGFRMVRPSQARGALRSTRRLAPPEH